ncbi:hypothetical protein NUW54_g13271 [Trametes sanguinea]|uniref:Uncharacterized protein n=1 Tax=Trametes sanguinea TaxID=158606 RepID=A0ACC1MNP3_9APHY|nr:hypothetical protein NUW54_g13271 [Trametes sanguinea]
MVRLDHRPPEPSTESLKAGSTGPVDETIHQRPGRPPKREITEHIETAPVHHPLPPEGQRYSGWLHALLGRPAHPAAADGAPHPDAHPHDGKGELRYWKAGWYLWWSKSRWAAQERMDLMRRSLGSQTEWQQLKERRNEEWERGGTVDEHRLNEDVQLLFNPNLPPFPDVSQDSTPPPPPRHPPSREQLHNVLAPTWKVLGLVRESVVLRVTYCIPGERSDSLKQREQRATRWSLSSTERLEDDGCAGRVYGFQILTVCAIPR